MQTIRNVPVRTEGKIPHAAEKLAPSPASDMLFPNPKFSDEALLEKSEKLTSQITQDIKNQIVSELTILTPKNHWSKMMRSMDTHRHPQGFTQRTSDRSHSRQAVQITSQVQLKYAKSESRSRITLLHFKITDKHNSFHWRQILRTQKCWGD